MQILVECYGVVENLCGGAELRLDVEGDSPDVAAALDALAERVPAAEAHLARTAAARGDALIGREEALQAGDRLALIPPVSGGSATPWPAGPAL